MLVEDFYVKSLQLNDADFEDGILDLRSPPAKPALTVHIEANSAAISGTVRMGSRLRTSVWLYSLTMNMVSTWWNAQG